VQGSASRGAAPPAPPGPMADTKPAFTSNVKPRPNVRPPPVPKETPYPSPRPNEKPNPTVRPPPGPTPTETPYPAQRPPRGNTRPRPNSGAHSMRRSGQGQSGGGAPRGNTGAPPTIRRR
jgi:protein TonB